MSRDYTLAMLARGRRWQAAPAPRAQARERLAGVLGLGLAELAGDRVTGGTLPQRVAEAAQAAAGGR